MDDLALVGDFALFDCRGFDFLAFLSASLHSFILSVFLPETVPHVSTILPMSSVGTLAVNSLLSSMNLCV